jgi:hypothetical protein
MSAPLVQVGPWQRRHEQAGTAVTWALPVAAPGWVLEQPHARPLCKDHLVYSRLNQFQNIYGTHPGSTTTTRDASGFDPALNFDPAPTAPPAPPLKDFKKWPHQIEN